MARNTNEWFVSTRSHNGNTCVETMFTDDAVYVRNSVTPDQGTTAFTHPQWAAFMSAVKDGTYAPR
ncbi:MULTISPECIES: DUF397 domain-containing protein [Actinoalloteichus]|uniref:DUF397 family protein n=1 Tax=Actinoalloteichus fjordicus TaxID=1612552 RepID=A0AAC9PQB0_9PSEU|nr:MULTISPECIES: DUF397 domain-containing protein [Actinoalloteichus]APU12696.1 putative DUF397 family protein [Actinoalloteichus fjordicus]APU18666.1 putative DUF397 family protein [Actinoalloteichus sp. GBA129-24]